LKDSLFFYGAGKYMRKWLAGGISIIAVILLTLTSISNVVGYQTTQTSQEAVANERVNPAEALVSIMRYKTTNTRLEWGGIIDLLLTLLSKYLEIRGQISLTFILLFMVGLYVVQEHKVISIIFLILIYFFSMKFLIFYSLWFFLYIFRQGEEPQLN